MPDRDGQAMDDGMVVNLTSRDTFPQQQTPVSK